jgi:hypothetical protein
LKADEREQWAERILAVVAAALCGGASASSAEESAD